MRCVQEACLSLVRLKTEDSGRVSRHAVQFDRKASLGFPPLGCLARESPTTVVLWWGTTEHIRFFLGLLGNPD